MKKNIFIGILAISQIITIYSLHQSNKAFSLMAENLEMLSGSMTATSQTVQSLQSSVNSTFESMEKDIIKQADDLNSIKTDLNDIREGIEGNKQELVSLDIRTADNKRDLTRVENEIFQPAKIYEKASKATVDVYGDGGIGSGFLFKEKNLIVTAYHLISAEPGTIVSITPHDGTYYWMMGKVKKIKPEWDLALIELPEPLKTEPLMPADKFSIGDNVAVIGNPGGLRNSFSSGVVSGLDRKISILPSIRLVQFSASVSFGSSGGVLLNEKGEVIGMTTASLDYAFGLAVPISEINEFVK